MQSRVLDRWSDGSVRWLLLRWQATLRGAARYSLAASSGPAPLPSPALALDADPDGIALRNGGLHYRISVGSGFPFHSLTAEGRAILDPAVSGIEIVPESGAVLRGTTARIEIEESGPLYVRLFVDVGLSSTAPSRDDLSCFARLHFFAGSPVVRFDLTLRNPRAARHQGGFWELGDPASCFLRSAAVRFCLSETGPTRVLCSERTGHALQTEATPFALYQDSSGGERWESPVHRNRFGRVPHRFRGYRARSGGAEREGDRAEPVVTLEAGGQTLSLAMPRFWKNFPKAVEADGRLLSLQLFPSESAEGHELQGGEQKTHSFFAAFGDDRVTDEPLAWCRSPSRPCADPGDGFGSGAIPHLLPPSLAATPRETLVRPAIEGPESFFEKRERIDEYGWRSFGDLYADHEARLHRGPELFVSHYNNQYDAIAGFATQFLRSGDVRWWELMDDLASHVRDIDVYHTVRDKSAYNRALFWHTWHYVDAGLATHRGYPRDPRVGGGGPSNEHNYTTGLLLHHFLTGDPASRDTVLDLARWVVDMDDGSKTVFRHLSRAPTGLASMTAAPDYHGPGRGAGHSINALLDAFTLTRERAHLDEAEELIRRCVHPDDDPAAHDLANAEHRWSYVIFLQKLGRYLEHKAELGENDTMAAYARAALLRYARWMAEHEHPYLEKPEILEHPTETWAAQDIRKSDVFHLAALCTSGAESERFRQKAREFYDYAVTTLAGMETRCLTRPIVILLTNGHLEERQRAGCGMPDLGSPSDELPAFPPRTRFQPQKAIAFRRFRWLAATGALVALGALLLAAV